MNRYKILSVEHTEIDYFEEFLNKMAAEGWHPVKSFTRYIRILKFEYKPELKGEYSVVYNQYQTQVQYSRRDTLSNLQSDQEFKDMLSDFDVETVMTYGLFDILYSENNISVFNEVEQGVDIKIRVTNKQMKQYVLICLLLVVISVININSNVVPIVNYLRTINLFISLNTLVYVVATIRLVIRSQKFIKGENPKKKTKWDGLSNINLTSLGYIAVFLFIIVLLNSMMQLMFSNNLVFKIIVPYIVLIALVVVIWRLIDRKNMGRNIRFVLKGVTVVILFWFFSINILLSLTSGFSTLNDNTIPSTTKVESLLCDNVSGRHSFHSFFLQETDIYCRSTEDSRNYTIYQIKSPIAKDALRERLINDLGINTFEYNKVFTYDRENYGYTSNYRVLITREYIIETDSDNEISESLVSYLTSLED